MSDAQAAITKLLIAKRTLFIGNDKRRNRHAVQQSRGFALSAVKSDMQ
jgi:hypothetical protein